MPKIEWTAIDDDQGNKYLEAPSPYNDDGVTGLWRLRQRLANNRIEWFCDSDEYVCGHGCLKFWLSQPEAMAAVEAVHDWILAGDKPC